MDVLPQGRHFLQVVHHSFMFCGGRCAIIGGFKYDGSCAWANIVCPCGKPYICNNAKLHGASGTPPPTIYMNIGNNSKGCRGGHWSPVRQTISFAIARNCTGRRGRRPLRSTRAFVITARGAGRAMLAPVRQKTPILLCRECRGEQCSPANLAQQRVFRENFSYGKWARASNARPYSPRMVVRRGRRCGVA